MIRILLSLLLAGLVLPSLLVDCHETESAAKEHTVTNKAAIPPIDTYVPPATETATFALG